MAEKKLGKALGARRARALLTKIGGVQDLQLFAELERVLGHKPPNEVYRLADGRVVDILYRSARLFESADEYRRLLALVEEIGKRKPRHPLGSSFPNGQRFIKAVPRLIQELSGKLQVSADALKRSVDSLEYLDKAVRRFGGQRCLDDPAILGPIIAYVGEAMREATAGRWEIREWNFHGGEESDRWQPVIVGADGRTYHPFGIFKDVLERGSIWARIEYDLGSSRAVRREQVRRSPTGMLGEVPVDAYRVTISYGDGTPRTVNFNRDVLIAGFPCRAGSEAGFTRTGELFSATLSQAHVFGRHRLAPGTFVLYRTELRDGRISHVVLGEDQEVDGLPCRAGTYVEFHPNQAVSGTTLASDRKIAGIPCAAGATVTFHKNGRLSVATLADDHVFNGRRFPRGTWFFLDERGHPLRVCLPNDWDIDGIPAKAGVQTMVEFHKNGRVWRVVLARSHSVFGRAYTEGTLLHFDEDGRLIYTSRMPPSPV
jgi:hypothetical protein